MEPHLPEHAPDVRLHVQEERNGKPRVTRLRHPLTLIGSRRGCRVRLQSAKVSPTHCALVHTGEKLVLRDLASALGTCVNDWESDACLLADGDRIQIRSREFLVRIDAQPAGECKSSANGASLAIRDGDGGVQYVSATPVVLVGRHSRCDLTLNDPKVSRAHALLFRVADRWAVADLFSANGLKVNGESIEGARTLDDGDLLQAGSTELHLEIGGRLAAEAPPPVERRRAAPSDSNDTITGELQARACALDARWIELEERAAQLDVRERDLRAREGELEAHCAAARQGKVKLEQDERRVSRSAADLEPRQVRLQEQAAELEQREAALEAARGDRERQLSARSAEQEARQQDWTARETTLDERATALERDRTELEAQRDTVQEQAARLQSGIERLESAMEAVKAREARAADERLELDGREAALAQREEVLARAAEETAARLDELAAQLQSPNERTQVLDAREEAVAQREARQREADALIGDIASSLTTWEHELCGAERLLSRRAVDLDQRLRHLVSKPPGAVPTASPDDAELPSEEPTSPAVDREPAAC